MTDDLFADLADSTPPQHGAAAPAPAPTADARAPRRGKAVQPVPPDAELAALGARLPANLFLGTSTWSYSGWNGIVYDGVYSDSLLSRKGLAAYARHPLLRSAGVDRGFYAPIPLADYLSYAGQVPADFRFLVKAPASVCDGWLRNPSGAGRLVNPAFLDAQIAARDLIEPATAGLGAKCGPLLFQLSPLGTLAHDSAGFLARLDAFLDALPPLDPVLAPHACYAVELRDPDLLTPRLIKLLRARGVRFCAAARERMPPLERLKPALALLDEDTPGPLVLRWMLGGGLSYEQAEAAYAPFDRLVDEDPHTRGVIADLVVHALRAGQPAYVIVSNKAEGSAPLSCVRLAREIAERLDA